MATTTLTDPGMRVTGGVDTHRDVHLVAALDERGGRLGVEAFPANAVGYRKSLMWLRSFGIVDRVGVEGTGTYGAGLARYLAEQGVTVIEVTCPNRQRRRSHGKSDPVDALSAARAAQGGEATARPKARSGNVEAIRALRVARRSANKARNEALNQMRALLVTGPEELRAAYRGTTVWRMVTAAARLRPSDPSTPSGATKFALRQLARRVRELEAEVARLDVVLVPLVTVTAPDLMARHGVGPETAGALLVTAGDNPERLRSESAFAHLCGSSPIDASSGLVVRKRLNRGGDRRANEALWRIVMVRMVSDPPNPPLRRAAHKRRALQTRDHPLSQTLRRPRALPPPRQPATPT